MLRTTLLHRKLKQTQWRQLLPGLVFALNTSESKAIKCVLYNVVFGRNAILPQDVLFDHNEHTRLAGATTPANYSEVATLLDSNLAPMVLMNLSLNCLDNIPDEFERKDNCQDKFRGLPLTMSLKFFIERGKCWKLILIPPVYLS